MSLILSAGLAIGAAECRRYATTLTTLQTASALELGSELARSPAALFAIVVVWEIGMRRRRIHAFEAGRPAAETRRAAAEGRGARGDAHAGGRVCPACGFENRPDYGQLSFPHRPFRPAAACTQPYRLRKRSDPARTPSWRGRREARRKSPSRADSCNEPVTTVKGSRTGLARRPDRTTGAGTTSSGWTRTPTASTSRSSRAEPTGAGCSGGSRRRSWSSSACS